MFEAIFVTIVVVGFFIWVWQAADMAGSIEDFFSKDKDDDIDHYDYR